MKKATLLLMLLSLVYLEVSAQDIKQNDVPSVIVNKFKTTFPKAQDIEWEKEGEAYQVEFETKEAKHKVWFNKSMAVTKHVESYVLKNIPSKLKSVFENDLKGFKLDQLKKITLNGLIRFEAEIENEKGEFIVILDEAGKILSMNAEK